MGMSFDEHMAQLKKLKSFHNGSYGASINFALDTMRKYQKIEQIISAELEYLHPFDRNKCIVASIKEVLEDG